MICYNPMLPPSDASSETAVLICARVAYLDEPGKAAEDGGHRPDGRQGHSPEVSNLGPWSIMPLRLGVLSVLHGPTVMHQPAIGSREQLAWRAMPGLHHGSNGCTWRQCRPSSSVTPQHVILVGKRSFQGDAGDERSSSAVGRQQGSFSCGSDRVEQLRPI